MRDELDHEIDLRECVKIAVKQKKVVLGVFFVSVFSVAARVFLLPRVYEVSMFIEPPVNAITDVGVQNFDSVANIKALIESGVHDVGIIEELHLQEKELHFDVTQPKDTRLIKISLKRSTDGVDAGKKILAKLLEKLALGYKTIIEDKRSRIDNQIRTIRGLINKEEGEIKLNATQLEVLADRERQLVVEINEAKSNSAKLFEKQDAAFVRSDSKNDATVLFYTAVQQNMNHVSQLKSDLADAKNKSKDLADAMGSLRNDMDANRIEIENQNLLKNDVQNLLMLREPHVSPRPVGPKRKESILIAGAVGLIVGVLSALFIERWKTTFA